MPNNLIDQHFEDALREMPEQKLSWSANRRIKGMLMKRVRELEGRMSWSAIFQRLVAVPVAMMLLLVTTGGYGFFSTSVVKGDFLYPVKSEIEPYLYPSNGTSEERIAFHLWLSDRRYQEVNEILQRLGRPPLAFLPSAQAQDIENSENPLDQLLLETLQSAVKQVDYALLITDEIRDVKRVTTMKDQIRVSVAKQKEFVKEAAPVLQRVRLKQMRLSRQQTTRSIVSPQEQPTATMEAVAVPAPLAPLAFETVVDEPLELNTVAELIDDHLAFQESLLVSVEETVAQADLEGKNEVVLSPDEQLAEIDPTPGDATSAKALTIHYEESKKVLSEEIAEAEEVAVEEKAEVREEEEEEVKEEVHEEIEVAVPMEVTPVKIEEEIPQENEGRERDSSAEPGMEKIDVQNEFRDDRSKFHDELEDEKSRRKEWDRDELEHKKKRLFEVDRKLLEIKEIDGRWTRD